MSVRQKVVSLLGEPYGVCRQRNQEKISKIFEPLQVILFEIVGIHDFSSTKITQSSTVKWNVLSKKSRKNADATHLSFHILQQLTT